MHWNLVLGCKSLRETFYCLFFAKSGAFLVFFARGETTLGELVAKGLFWTAVFVLSFRLWVIFYSVTAFRNCVAIRRDFI